LPTRATRRRSCSATEVYPPKASDDVRTYVLIVRGSRGCNRSDELRILRVRDGDLRRVYDFQPQRPPGGFYRLVCRGADVSSPCTVRGAGTDPAIVAGWADTASGIVVPFVVQRRRGRYAAQGIERAQVVDEEARAAREARARYRREVVLRSSGDPPIEGYPVEDFAVVVVGDNHPARARPRLARDVRRAGRHRGIRSRADPARRHACPVLVNKRRARRTVRLPGAAA